MSSFDNDPHKNLSNTSLPSSIKLIMTSDYKNFSVPPEVDSISVECESISNTVYEYMYGDVASYIMYYMFIVLSLTVCPLLCISIVLYEHFGADRQKRTILNRILSCTLSNIAILSFFWGLLRILRDALGLLPPLPITWLHFFTKSIAYSTILFTSELAMFRFLFIVVWKRMKAINDEFWMTVLAMSTYLIAFYSILTAHFIGSNVAKMPWIINVNCTEKG